MSARSRWAVGSTPTLGDAWQPATCRACGGEVHIGDRILIGGWEASTAHQACGWLAPEERGLLTTIAKGEHVGYSATLLDLTRWGYATDRFVMGKRVVALTDKARRESK